MIMNKSLITNLVSLSLIGISFVLVEPFKNSVLFMGLFAFSGALTNQIAIHMLFEKVPFLYGSGIIILRFESFKNSIKELMMSQFFNKKQLNDFFTKEEKKIDLTPIIDKTDFSPAYDALTKTVMESQFGSMLGMFGGESALEKMRQPFVDKLKASVVTIAQSDKFHDQIKLHLQDSSFSDDMLDSIEHVIDTRLQELTPLMVKEIVQTFMRQHLGWLVVWGGFFGGLIGLVSSIVI
ncbi:MAG: DUF445 domain-containing protein [Sulfurospirillum sp.]|nr:DUF445 domain-containing protein [Sulfurospirillum sp.]MBL0702638.1 DUF445 domain-containing protein [Sulfurospirillum sp.]